MDDLTVVGLRADQRLLVPVAAELRHLAATQYLVTVRASAVDEAGDARQMVGVDQRADRRGVVVGIAEHLRIDVRVETREKVVDYRLLNEQTRARQADLAGVVVLQRSLGRRGVKIGVGEDNEGVLATELGGEGHDVLRAGAANVARGLGRAGEAEAPDATIGRERGADLLANALYEIEDARREARPVDEIEEQGARQRRPLGGLEHDGAAGGERGRALPRREHERRVPRGDHDGRAARVAHHAVGGAVRLPDALRVLTGEVGVGAEVAGSATDHAGLERALEHRHVPALDLGDVVDVLIDQVGQAVQIRGTPLGAERGPGGEGADGGADRGIGGGGIAATHLGQQRAVDRRPVFERCGTADAGAIDVVLRRDGVTVDLDAIAHASPRRSVIVSRSFTEYAKVKR